MKLGKLTKKAVICIATGAVVVTAVIVGAVFARTSKQKGWLPEENVTMEWINEDAENTEIALDDEYATSKTMYICRGCDVFDSPGCKEMYGILTLNESVKVKGIYTEKNEDASEWYCIEWENDKNGYVRAENVAGDKVVDDRVISAEDQKLIDEYNKKYGGYAVDKDGNITPIPGTVLEPEAVLELETGSERTVVIKEN